ncbi:MAG: adenylate/guanylate cyclase domain-containing protein, partial [Thermodesulfobacteriota bacterium]
LFKHALTQEVAYSSLLLARRKEVHEEVGKAIEEVYRERLEEHYELLAYHYVRSNNRAAAVKYLDLSNRKAVKVYAMEDALARFQKAMDLLDTLPDTGENRERRISLLANQHLVFFFLLRNRDYHELLIPYESTAEALQHPGLCGAFYNRMGICAFTSGRFDQSIKASTRAAKLCEAGGDTEEAGHSYFQSAMSHFWKGDFERALALKEDVLRMVKRRFHLRNYVRALCVSSWDEGLELGKEALAKAREYSDKGLMSWAEWNLSALYTHKGDLDRAIEYAERAVEEAPTPGDKAFAQGWLARAWCRAGEYRKGIEVSQRLLALYRAAGYVTTELFALQFLGEGYWLAGEYEKAREAAEELRELAARCGARAHLGNAYRLLGETALTACPEEGAAHFEESIAIFRDLKAESALAHAHAGFGRYHREQGNTQQAREHLNKALEIFDRLGVHREPEKLREELSAL